MFPLRFKDLASISGVHTVYGPSEEEKAPSQMANRVKGILSKYPELGDVKVYRSNRDAYDYINNAIHVRSRDADILAHEMEHAASLRDASPTYKKLLAVSQSAVKLNNTFALPALVALGNTIEDPAKKRAVYKTLLGLSAVAAAPNIWEEAKASANVVMDSPDQIQSLKTLLPAFGSHLVHDLTGAGVYLGALKLQQHADGERAKADRSLARRVKAEMALVSASDKKKSVGKK